jgi:glycosyltransferase involved in cell wall biosynthesis
MLPSPASALSITVLVPVYNEAALVEPSTEALVRYLRGAFPVFEVVIIESGSTDGTAALCDALAKTFPEVRIIHEGARNGFGSAMKIGFAAARHELVTMMTLDLPFPFESISEAAARIGEYDCVLSYRSVDARKSRLRKVQSWVFNNLLKIVLGLRTRHLNSALKVYRRHVIQSLPLVSRGWFIDTEIVYWLERKGTRCAEIPVPLIERQTGRSSTTLFTPFQILKEAWRFSRSQRGR